MPDIDGGDYEAGAAGDKRAFFHAVDNSFVAFGAVILRGEGGNNLRESKEEHQRQTFNALTGGNCGNFAGTQLVNRNLENDAANRDNRALKTYGETKFQMFEDKIFVEGEVFAVESGMEQRDLLFRVDEEHDAADNLRERRCKRYADNSAVEDNDCNYVEDRVHKERR